ncbi:MAG: hypothetical protein IKQ72_10200, partial [Bacteroidaceae bacterium]|nr:hypothetical protein [Bacteroidaceae bacterium]
GTAPQCGRVGRRLFNEAFSRNAGGFFGPPPDLPVGEERERGESFQFKIINSKFKIQNWLAHGGLGLCKILLRVKNLAKRSL